MNLLPCPFCGGEGYQNPEAKGLVVCLGCSADVVHEKNAAQVWNNRVEQSEPKRGFIYRFIWNPIRIFLKGFFIMMFFYLFYTSADEIFDNGNMQVTRIYEVPAGGYIVYVSDASNSGFTIHTDKVYTVGEKIRLK